ncbi:MAG: YdcF family protein [Acidobacteria bacterium]|nr:YdcF family protein [Acidobacteriota bacterium]
MSGSGRPGKPTLRILWRFVRAFGVLTLVLMLWLAAGWPVGIDRWLDVTEPPEPAAAIVVLGGGTGAGSLPLQQGWERINTAHRLYAAGFAPVVIFSGSGTQNVSQSEIYANAAAWMGIPRSVMVLEATAGGTQDHGHALRGMVLPTGAVIAADTPLLVVTSTFHSRRALMAFSRAGFTRVRVVSQFTASPPDASEEPSAPAVGEPPEGTVRPDTLTNSVADYQPSDKRYGDLLFRLAHRTFDFFINLREMGAILLS